MSFEFTPVRRTHEMGRGPLMTLTDKRHGFNLNKKATEVMGQFDMLEISVDEANKAVFFREATGPGSFSYKPNYGKYGNAVVSCRAAAQALPVGTYPLAEQIDGGFVFVWEGDGGSPEAN